MYALEYTNSERVHIEVLIIEDIQLIIRTLVSLSDFEPLRMLLAGRKTR